MVILSRKITLCESVWRKGTGLMFHRKRDDFAFVFPFKKAMKLQITMWFVFFPIDILFLDKEGYIIEVVENLKPFSYYFAKRKAFTFVELPAGTVKKESLQLGNGVEWNSILLKTSS